MYTLLNFEEAIKQQPGSLQYIVFYHLHSASLFPSLPFYRFSSVFKPGGFGPLGIVTPLYYAYILKVCPAWDRFESRYTLSE